MTKWILTLTSITLLISSCGKKETRPKARSIYDLPVFAKACQTSIEEGFSTFKQNPYLGLLWENRTEEQGREALQAIEQRYPLILQNLDKLKTGDQIGSPRLYQYGEHGSISPYTLYTAALCGDIAERCGDLAGKNIVQIGAGYGALCHMLHTLYPLSSYTLIDLPEQLALAKKYLESLGVMGVHYISIQDGLPKGSYDLLLSDQSFSEFSRDEQKRMIDRLFSHCASGYVRGHLFPKHFGVVALNPGEIIKILKRSVLYLEEPEHDRDVYFIQW